MSLLLEEPEAKQFCKITIDKIQDFKLSQEEEFIGLQPSILATSNLDSQGEAFSYQALESGVRHINKEILWIGAHHDPLIQPLGRVVSAQLFYSNKSQIYFIAAVIGFYATKSYKRFKDLGIDFSNLIIDDVSSLPRNINEQIQVSFCPFEIDRIIIDEILTDAPNMVMKQSARSIRKTGEPTLTIITILASIWFLTNNPFSKKFLERYGEKAADSSAQVFSWLFNRLFRKITELKGERVLVEFASDYSECHVQFVIPSKDVATLCEASKSIHMAGQSAINLINNHAHLELQKLIYEFDTEVKIWLPLHAVSKKFGVITDRPSLIAIDQMQGLSMGGITDKESIQKIE